MGDEVDFLSVDTNKIFLQDDSIILIVHSQTCPKYRKQAVYNIFGISQGKHEGWRWLFACWMFLPNDTSILGVCSQACPNYLKQQVWYLPATLRKKWVTQLIFYMQISMKTCYNLTLRFFDGYDQAFPKFSK